MFKVTEEWIEQNKTEAGGWKAKQLRAIGVKWPPRAGWKKAVQNKLIGEREKALFESFAGKEDSPAVVCGQGIEIFTDGSCDPNPGTGGWGYAVYMDGVEVHSAFGGEKDTTNNRMELQAIIEAFKWLNGREARIFSDSDYCVTAINQWSKKWIQFGWKRTKNAAEEVKNADLFRIALGLKGNANLLWVKGHAGIAGNERADDLSLMWPFLPENWQLPSNELA